MSVKNIRNHGVLCPNKDYPLEVRDYGNGVVIKQTVEGDDQYRQALYVYSEKALRKLIKALKSHLPAKVKSAAPSKEYTNEAW